MRLILIDAISSVPCFEYWLILHFGYTDAPIERVGGLTPGEEAVRQLRSKMPGYTKGSRRIYAALRDRLDDAIRNAAQILKQVELRCDDNPSTRVHLLVTQFRGLRKPNWLLTVPAVSQQN